MKIDIDKLSEEELVDLNHRDRRAAAKFEIKCGRTRRCWISRLAIG